MVAVTDGNNDRSVGGNLVIDIKDDKPVAVLDTANLSPSDQSASGNVITGPGGVDVAGADGGLHVVSVAFGGGSPVAVGATDAVISTAHGTLTLGADGHYTYTRTSAGSDVFSYTVADSDGSQSTATLTVNVGNATPGASHSGGGQRVRGDEAGLAGGSSPAAPSETTSGTITFTSPTGCRRSSPGAIISLHGGNGADIPRRVGAC